MERPNFSSEKGHLGYLEAALIVGITFFSLWAANEFAKDAIDFYFDRANPNEPTPTPSENINSFENSFNSDIQGTRLD